MPATRAACAYGVWQGWVSRLVARYRAEGEAAFEPRSRRPKTSPTATSANTVELIIRLRKQLSEQGLDAGPDTIAWHLRQHHQLAVSRATISRYLTAHGLVVLAARRAEVEDLKLAVGDREVCGHNAIGELGVANGSRGHHHHPRPPRPDIDDPPDMPPPATAPKG
jgi:Homeodomain-like domain